MENDRNPTYELDTDQIVVEKIVNDKGEVIKTKRFLKGKLLGKGGFAKCYEFTCLDTNETYACKVVVKSSLTKSKRQKLIAEIKIHKAIDNVNVVRFLHYFEDSENVYILMEMCGNKSMNDLLKRRKVLTELEIKCYSVQLLRALKYMHSHRIIHRDLKLGNLFLTDKMELKLGDFGLAVKLEFDGQRKKTYCGTPNYMAPEIIENKTGYSYEIDIWAVGIIMYTLAFGKPPFEGEDLDSTFKKIKGNNYSFPEKSEISDSCKGLIKDLLAADPTKRPKINKILNYDFFTIGIIPKLLPPFTIACPPSSSYIKQHMPGAVEVEVDTPKVLPKTTDTKDNPTNINNFKLMSDKNKSTQQFDSTNFTNLNIHDFGSMNNFNKVSQTTARVKKDGTEAAEIWVKKWMDYSTKYGLGYLLNNGSIGVLYNDSSRALLDLKSQQFTYMLRKESSEIATKHTLTDYPKDLQKKVTILLHFKKYLEVEQFEKSFSNNIVYVKKWIKMKDAIIFRFSNKVVQVCFRDSTEVISSSDSAYVTYVKDGERKTYALSTILESNNNDLIKKLEFVKEMFNQILTSQGVGDSGKRKDI
jgi:polo-like kinase 1